MTKQLKPCPFCGGEAKEVRAAKAYHVYCSECGCDTMVSTTGAMTTCQIQKLKMQAADKWNARTSDSQQELINELTEMLNRACDAACEPYACGEDFAEEVMELLTKAKGTNQ